MDTICIVSKDVKVNKVNNLLNNQEETGETTPKKSWMFFCFLETTVICSTLFVKCDTSRERSGLFRAKICNWSSIRNASRDVTIGSSSISIASWEFLVDNFLVKTCTIDSQFPFYAKFICSVVKNKALLLSETLG